MMKNKINNFIEKQKVSKQNLPANYLYWVVSEIKESNFKVRHIQSINSTTNYIVNFHKPIL